MKGKVILSVVSLILVVGVAIGVVVSVQKKAPAAEDPQIKTQQRYLGAVCSNADDKKFCEETLKSVNGTDPKAYIATIVKAATDSVIKAFNMTDRLSTQYGKDENVKMNLDDCKDLMQFALDSLQLSDNMVRDNNILSIHQQLPDIRNWLSAVISYQQACTENFNGEDDGQKKIKEQLHTESLDHVEKVTGIALDIVSDLAKILEQFGLKLDLKPASRRLLSDIEVDSEGYPTWFSAADRKLLGKLNKKGKGKGKGKGKKLGVGPIAGPGPNAVVAKDGSGQFKTISAAIASYPKGFKGRYVIYVKAGVYAEQVIVPSKAVNVLMYGDGPGKTIVTGNKHHPTGTMQTATFANEAFGFIAKGMTFENTAGAKGLQAVAFRNQGDQSAVVDCHLIGHQDTIYIQTNRQFYRDCVIKGTIDFIFGTATALVQRSTIVVRQPLPTQYNVIVADGRKQKSMSTGIVVQDCQIVKEGAFPNPTYLGRPWFPYARAVIMESTIPDFIHPDGWIKWDPKNPKEPVNTFYFAEYGNTGPGANTQRRVKYPGYHGVISKAEATQFTAAQFLKAGPTAAATWVPALNVPHYLGFKA